MEIIEGNVRVNHRPVVTIGDKDLEKCPRFIVERTVLALLKRIAELREQNEHLTSRLSTAWAEVDKLKEGRK